MTEQPNREVAVLNAALELRPEERTAYLDEACAGDAALRQQVEDLLRADAAAEGFLEAPPAGLGLARTVSASVPLTEKPGDKIGHYKLLQQIGEGGCGVVYMAEQEEPVRRRVALKVIKLGMDTKQVIARFEAERQALALMDHPNIAKIYEAGISERPLTPSLSPAEGERVPKAGEGSANSQPSTLNPQLSPGRPYFVMELVRGIKITDFCDENNVSTADRLKLFVQVCQAIQHAHQKGIIHRDIKPSNILVTVNDGVPVPKVIDFGIAKATQGRLTDQTLFTAFEQFIGTPAYMSPEQAVMTSLDIDTRSDIYSLGVLLYELLTGKTPFDQAELLAAGLDEMRRTIREKEPLKPSTRLTQELVTAGKVGRVTPCAPPIDASSPDNGARGATRPASQLSTLNPQRLKELIHLLRGDLDWIVMKCLEKDRARRYETANGVATDILRHLNCEPVVARPPSRLYEFQKTVRRHKFGFAAGAALITVLAVGVLVSTSEAIRATSAEREQSRLREAAQQAQANEARLRQKAEADEKKAETEGAKSRQVAQFLEDMLQSVGPSVAKGRDTTILQEILEKTTTRVGKDLTNQPEVETELRTILAETYLDLDLPRQAERIARTALERARLLYGETNLFTSRLLVDIGSARFGVEDRNGAEDFMRQGLTIQRLLLPHDHPDIARTLDRLAETLRRFGRPAEAEAPQREALAIKQALFGDHDPSLVPSLNNLGLVLGDLGRRDEAESVLKSALPLSPKDTVDAAITLGRLGKVVSEEGKLPEAEAILREAVGLDRRMFGTNSPELSWNHVYLADVLQSQNKMAEAEALYREAVAIDRNDWPNRPDALSVATRRLVTLLIRERKHREAEQFLGELVDPSVINRPDTISLLQLRADISAHCGHWQPAAADMIRVVDSNPSNHSLYHVLAPLLVASGDLAEYRKYCQEITARFGNTTDPFVGDQMAKDCSILPAAGADPDIVGRMAQTAVAAGPSNRFFAYFECTKGLVDYRQGQFASALDWMGKTIEIGGHRGNYQWDDYLYVEACAVSAMAHYQLKQTDDARAALAKANWIAEAKLPKLDGGDIGNIWRDWIITHKLLDEAKVLIEGTAPNGAAQNQPPHPSAKLD